MYTREPGSTLSYGFDTSAPPVRFGQSGGRGGAAWGQLIADHIDARALFCYGFAMLLGVGFVAVTLTLTVAASFKVNDLYGSSDMAQHAIGQRYFIADTWRWPLLVTRLIHAPVGVSIAMTDSIPIAALLAKSLRSFLPPGSTTLFPWLAFAFIMQPIAAVFALRSAGERRVIPALAISIFAISIPTLLYRIGHVALCSHFLMLIAIGQYFRAVRQSLVPWASNVLLVLASLLVHPYLWLMVVAILAAAPLTLLLRGEHLWWRALVSLCLALAVCDGAALCLSYGGQSPGGGYGVASMNLVSPFYPRFSSLFEMVTGRPAAAIDATGFQYEGYQYLGAGLLVVLLATVGAARWGGLLQNLRAHAGAWIVCFCLVLLACSTTVYAGEHKLVALQHIPAFLHQLRASGRFFWPVTYFLLVGSVVVVARLPSGALAAVLLIGAAGLQWADAASLRSSIVDLRRNRPPTDLQRMLRPVVSAHRQLTLWPTPTCGQEAGAPIFLDPILIASETASPVNTMYLARYPPAEEGACDTRRVTGPLRPGELRLFLPSAATTALMIPDAFHVCRVLGPYVACSASPGLLGEGPAPSAADFQIGERVEMKAPQLPAVAVGGWYGPEPPATWTMGPEAVLAGRFEAPSATPIGLTVWAGGLGDEAAKTVTVRVDDRVVATWAVRHGSFAPYHATIPADLATPGVHMVRFEIARPVRPIDYSGVPDTRELGIFVQAFEFDRLAPSTH